MSGERVRSYRCACLRNIVHAGVFVQVNWVYVRLLKTPFNRAGNPDYLAQWQVGGCHRR